MIGLYPAIKPYAKHELAVDEIHNLYIEEVGNPEGIPLLFLHDGPGKGVLKDDRRLFDPKRYRVILFDQRGCGRSSPYAEITNNTTQDLLADISAILTFFKLNDSLLFGEGWGATLAVLFAIQHKEKVQGLILHSLFLGRHRDLQWQFSEHGGGAQLFPEHYDAFVQPAKDHSVDAILSAYGQLLLSDNELEKMTAAKAWLEWQTQIGNPHPEYRHKIDLIDADIAQCMSRLQCHYFAQNCFLVDDHINDNAIALSHLQVIMVHGRFDIANPLAPVYALYQCLPLAQLMIVPYAGHFDCEPGLMDALRNATEVMADIIDFRREQ